MTELCADKMQNTPIILAPYSAEWPGMFTSERAALSSLYPLHTFQIEHIGSTAVPGLAAKPLIDIMLGAPSLVEIEAQIEGLARLGYAYFRHHEKVMPYRRFFAKPEGHPRHFHLHAVVRGEKFWNEHLLFRDALRNNARLAEEYAALKLRLAAQFGTDRDGYTDAKTTFITTAIRRAGGI